MTDNTIKKHVAELRRLKAEKDAITAAYNKEAAWLLELFDSDNSIDPHSYGVNVLDYMENSWSKPCVQAICKEYNFTFAEIEDLFAKKVRKHFIKLAKA